MKPTLSFLGAARTVTGPKYVLKTANVTVPYLNAEIELT